MESKRTRDRAAYQKQYQLLKKQYFHLPPGHPDLDLTWEEFRTKHLHSPGHTPRKPITRVNERTDRQKYQATYQAARRAAQVYYSRTPMVKSQYGSFDAYWAAMKHTYVPHGFFAGRKHLARKEKDVATKQDRSDYMVAYRRQRRKWDTNEALREEYADWPTYWEHVKDKAFHKMSPANNPRPAPITRPAAVYLEGDVIEDTNDWLVAA